MEYYIVYDLNDNIIAYCDNITELINFTGLRKSQVKYKFNKREFLYYRCNKKYLKIYRFFEEISQSLFLCATLFL